MVRLNLKLGDLLQKVSVVILLTLPAFALAQDTRSFGNPLSFTSIQGLLAAILNAVIVISIPFVVFFLIYAGFKYVTAQGNPDEIKAANKALTFGVIGGVIIIASVAIVQIITNLVESF